MNLSKRHFSKYEISLLSKGLKFVPTSKHIKKAKLETHGKKLRLMWHYRNEEREITSNSLKKKAKFNPRGEHATVEIYLSRLEEEIFSLDKNT